MGRLPKGSESDPSVHRVQCSAGTLPVHCAALGASALRGAVPPRSRSSIGGNGSAVHWRGRENSYTATAGETRAMSRKTNARFGNARYGRVHPAWFVDFP